MLPTVHCSGDASGASNLYEAPTFNSWPCNRLHTTRPCFPGPVQTQGEVTSGHLHITPLNWSGTELYPETVPKIAPTKIPTLSSAPRSSVGGGINMQDVVCATLPAKCPATLQVTGQSSCARKGFGTCQPKPFTNSLKFLKRGKILLCSPPALPAIPVKGAGRGKAS